MKKANLLIKILGIFFIIVFLLIVFRNQVIKSVVTIGASKVVGVKVEIDDFSLGIFSQFVHIKGFRVYNPEGFDVESTMINIPEIRVDYSLPEILKGNLHFPLIILNINEVMLVTNKEGKTNIYSLAVAQPSDKKQEKVDKKEPVKKDQKKATKEISMQIDVLKLNLSKIVQKDYTKDEKGTVKVIETSLQDKEYKNITSAGQLVSIILFDVTKGTLLKGAGVYGAATVLSAGFLPVGAAAVLMSKDSGIQEFAADVATVYKNSLSVISAMGALKSEDSVKGVIRAKIDGADVAIKIEPGEQQKTKITVSARKMMIPKPDIAKGVIHQIEQTFQK